MNAIFAVLLDCKSIDRSTFCMKCDSASLKNATVKSCLHGLYFMYSANTKKHWSGGGIFLISNWYCTERSLHVIGFLYFSLTHGTNNFITINTYKFHWLVYLNLWTTRSWTPYTLWPKFDKNLNLCITMIIQTIYNCIFISGSLQ